MGVTHPRFEIGSSSASPSFGTLIKCVGGQVEWAGAAENQKCPQFASWTLLIIITFHVRTMYAIRSFYATFAVSAKYAL